MNDLDRQVASAWDKYSHVGRGIGFVGNTQNWMR